MSNESDIHTVETGHRIISTTLERHEECTKRKPLGLAPKLGDFHKLYEAIPLVLIDRPYQIVTHKSTAAEDSVCKAIDGDDSLQQISTKEFAKLGDFHKIQARLNNEHTTSETEMKWPLCPHLQQAANYFDKTTPDCPPSGDDKANAESVIGNDASFDIESSTSTYHNQGKNSSRNGTSRLEDSNIQRPVLPAVETGKPTTRLARILSYQIDKHGPITRILGPKSTLEEQHESLSLKLVPLLTGDASLAAKEAQVARNGIHVFLDMSNINISFHNALRGRFSIEEHARFVPLPQLNLQFLTEIFVRGRKTMVLNAGCSVIPHREEPRYVQQLRDLGYHVDLRERKRTCEPRRWGRNDARGGEASSSDELVFSQNAVRYIEELVDETLQTRIAESVMEFFEDQGTLVIATGDGQPAKYSDGFFAYAERALRMGWNVEVVSWNISLSSYWHSVSWAEQWGERFRIIELDDYIKDLLV